MINRVCLNNKVTFFVEGGHKLEEWVGKYGTNPDIWDISVDDFLNGAVEPNEDCVYWYIDGRLYETDECAF